MLPINMLYENRYFGNTDLVNSLELLSKYDIICLQECYITYNIHINTFINKSKQLGFNHFILPDKSLFHICDSGLMILSKLPIVEYKFIPFISSKSYDTFAPKGIQYIKVKIGDIYIDIINTHLQSDYNIKYPEIRKDQMGQLSKFINELDDFIVCGDFNISNTGKEYNDMLNNLSLSYNDDLHTVKCKECYTYNSKYSKDKKRLDYILTKLDIIDSNIINTHLHSDHNPIDVTIKLHQI
jgi:endonuclease/exonuclease/phosphatase family metal-dependent hydrolase